MLSDRAPISPRGWQVYEHFYDGEPPRLFLKHRSLEWLRRLKSNWLAGHSGVSELVISPVDGWESLKADPFGAIAWAIKSDLVSIEVGASLIRAIASRTADSLQPADDIGLAAFYTDAAVRQLGGDEQLEILIDELRENQQRLVKCEDSDEPPF